MIVTEFRFCRLLLLLGFLSFSVPFFAQGPPPGGGPPDGAGPPRLDVASTGSLLFGKFSKINGGTIVIDSNNAVSSSGDIFLVNSFRSIVVFEVSSNKDGRVVNVTAQPTVLDGPGGSVLELSPILDKTSFIINSGTPVSVYMGGTLNVGQEDLSGNYNGTVSVTFAFQ